MKPTNLCPGCYLLDLGGVNAYVLTEPDLVLIDTGNLGDDSRILAALASLGYDASQLAAVILTHHHPDHVGAAAALRSKTEAPFYMHPEDSEALKTGLAKRPNLQAAPGLLNRLLFRFLLQPAPGQVAPCEVNHALEDGQVLPYNGGLEVIHTPGHTAGHVSLLWHEGNMLFAADAAVNIPRLRVHPGYESFPTGRQSLRRLAALSFERATFGHGGPILKGADQVFKRYFGV